MSRFAEGRVFTVVARNLEAPVRLFKYGVERGTTFKLDPSIAHASDEAETHCRG